MMLPLKSISLLGLTPILQTSACRFAPLFSQQDLRPQCFSRASNSSYSDLRSPPRALNPTTSPRAYSTISSQAAPQQSIAYRVGASFSAKGHRFDPKRDHYTYDPASRASTKYSTGRPTSGQDAFFVSRVGNGTSLAFGVADGVGGWADSGIDSAHFSHGLCDRMVEAAESTNKTAEETLGAEKLLKFGYDGVVADETIAGGGSTACVAVGKGNGSFQVANLGDSGFVQLRLNAVHYYSDPQTHAFNTPYQLSIIPPKVLARSKIFGGQPLSDYPRDASVTNHQVRHGDVLVFATDGVWDNLSSVDLLRIVSRHMTSFQAWQVGEKGLEVSDHIRDLTIEGGIAKEHENTLQTLLAVTITGEAKMASLNTKRDGPFAREVKKFYPGEDYHGGKVDDICAVVAIVVEE